MDKPMHRALLVAAFSALQLCPAASVAGTPAVDGPSSLGFAKQSVGATCPSGAIVGRISGDNTQIGRIKRDSRPSTCDQPKTFPGVLDATRSYHYETLSFANPSPVSSCVRVRFDAAAGAAPCFTNAHVAAYADRYDPDDQEANFLGDIGSNTSSEFAFELPGGADLVLAFSNTTLEQRCDFAVEVSNIACANVGGVGSERQTIPVNDSRALIVLLAALMLLGNLAVSRSMR